MELSLDSPVTTKTSEDAARDERPGVKRMPDSTVSYVGLHRNCGVTGLFFVSLSFGRLEYLLSGKMKLARKPCTIVIPAKPVGSPV